MRAGIAAGLLLLLLAACGSSQKFPALAPIEQARFYGYSEKPLGADRYTISYVAAARSGSGAPELRQRDADAAGREAFDLALWRAALLAQAGGFEGFRVSNPHTEVETIADPLYVERVYDGPFGVGVDPQAQARSAGFGTGGEGADAASIRLRGRASIDVELLHSLRPGDYDAGDVLGSLQHTYPDATRLPPSG